MNVSTCSNVAVKAISLFTRLGWLSLEGRSQYRILDRQALEDRATL